MDAAFTLLAVVGAGVVLVGFLRAAVSVLRREAEAFFAGETASTHARRGDLTSMAEAESQAAGARRARWRALARLGVWTALLLGPLLTPWTREVYAVYAGVWLIVHGVERRRR